MHETYIVHTWTCDIPDCKEKKTVYGDYSETDVYGDWTTELIRGKEFDLCPDHTSEVRKFFFND